MQIGKRVYIGRTDSWIVGVNRKERPLIIWLGYFGVSLGSFQ